MKANPQVPCSLVVNVARGDTPILEYTLPHILDSHKVRFAEVVVVIDEQPAEGRIGQRYHQYPLEDLYGTLEKIRGRGYGFRQEVISYKPDDVQRVFSKWFGHSRVTYRCAGGTPIYAFLYGLETAHYDFRLHLDSDMLIYDPGPTSWIEQGRVVLQNIPAILFVNQTWGIQTSTSPAPESVPSFDRGYGQRVSQVFSTRCFLFSMDELEKTLLPIKPIKHPLMKRIVYKVQRRSPYVALEQMIGNALSQAGTFRADLDMEWGFNLHAWDKSVFQDSSINDVLKKIEAGRFPIAHTGQHNLDYDLFLEQIGER